MVAKLFVDKPHGFEQVDHIDCDPLNNKWTNLRWVKNAKENFSNPLTLQKMSQPRIKDKIMQIDPNTGKTIHIWGSALEIQKTAGLHSGNILACCRGKFKTCCGYIWKFV